jgi:hypothetical protein
MSRILAALAVALIACGHNVGDPCSTNVDCSPLGDRFCDTSAPGGYCTIDGCDVSTCPGNAVCIRFFTPILDEPCELNMTPNGCRPSERCVCDSSVNGVCPMGTPDHPTAHCAPETSERRWCQKGCSVDSDCRPAYQCRQTGTLGAEPVPSGDLASGTPAKFCAPQG